MLELLPAQARAHVGPLHVEGTTFRRADGTLFAWHGYSMFLAYRRFLAGENLRPDLATLRGFGVNVLRVFGPLDWTETPDYRFEHFDVSRLGAFFAFCAAEGFYVEFVIGCYTFGPVATQRAFARTIYAIAQQHPNVLIEAVNEPSVGSKPDPVAMLKGVDRHGVLTAYGLYASYYAKPGVFPPVLDYGTIHIQRDSAWHRKARHAQEVQHATGTPWISDEPAKITEPGFHYVGGKNDPVRTPAEAVWHFAVCALWTSGGTFHCEEGKWGRVPSLGMLQYDVLRAVSDHVWSRIDATWQTGKYNGSHMSSSPVDFLPDIWTYTSVHPDRALAVRCAFSAPNAKPGWTEAEAWGPGHSILRLTR